MFPLTVQCKVDPDDPDGPCVECKNRRRGDTCNKIPGLPGRRRLALQRPYPSLSGDANYERLRNDIDDMRRSHDEVKNALNAIQQTLTMLLAGTNSSIVPSQSPGVNIRYLHLHGSFIDV